jgi:hypothetical protein
MNNKISFFLTLLFFSNCLLFSQTKDNALRDAKTTSEATLKMDFKTVLKHTYPSIVDMMGGNEKAVELLVTTFDSMKEQGFVFEKADIINVSEIVKEQDQYRCVIEGYNQMVFNGMRIKSKSFLLGIYDEDKAYWYFLEAKQLKNTALVEQVLPGFKTELNIPDDEMTTEDIKE